MVALSVSQRWTRARELGIIIDLKDKWLIDNFTWNISKKGFAEASIYIPHKQFVRLHHMVLGRPLFDLEVVHKNGNKMDNRRANLEFRSKRAVIPDTPREGPKHYKVSRSGRLEARLHRNGKYVHLGTFRTIEEVDKAVADYERKCGALT